jgi:predicted ribosome quality control (RQC) complex YloA/Tae2 family protein
MKQFLSATLLLLSCLPTSLLAQETKPDTVLMVKLPPHEISSERKWMNDTARYHYNQTKYYVKTILPYLNEANRLFSEMNKKMTEPGLSKKDRKRFMNEKEDEVRDRFESKIKGLNETQGVLLVKLIARQTGVNIYAMMQEFKNPLTAVRWQAWARINGFNLNRRYHPEEEPLLEQVMTSLGYPLPALYSNQGTATASTSTE